MDTSKERLGFGAVEGRGEQGDFRALAAAPGEVHVDRAELYQPGPDQRPGRSRLRLAHLTDFQFLDPGSPTRFEFVNKLVGLATMEEFFPGHRSQELLVPFAVEAAIRYVNELDQEGGRRFDMCLISGDSVDNSQGNELQALVAILEGGDFSLEDYFGAYYGVQSAAWEDDFYWHPDPVADLPKRMLGYPHAEGLLDAVRFRHSFEGLRVPWLMANGNHEVLIQGMGRLNEAVAGFAIGGAKPRGVDVEATLTDLPQLASAFEADPQSLFSRAFFEPIDANPRRAPLTRDQQAAILAGAGGDPIGHGLAGTALQDREGLYFSHLDAASQTLFVNLDTAKRGGGAEGFLGRGQLAWLEGELAAMSEADPEVLIVLGAHHGPQEIDYSHPGCVSREELLAAVHRHGQVALWICGHTHENLIEAFADPERPGRGFFSVTTSSIMDWPCALREIEVFEMADGSLMAETTIHHYSYSADPHDLSVQGLAGWHLRLAANSPYVGLGRRQEGRPRDRNARLWLGPRA
ncbi:MAG: metallophosphoesterase [Actinomycetota bacterium]|nr:metallophosphoesterase [Actinomycetota bacterium]